MNLGMKIVFMAIEPLIETVTGITLDKACTFNQSHDWKREKRNDAWNNNRKINMNNNHLCNSHQLKLTMEMSKIGGELLLQQICELCQISSRSTYTTTLFNFVMVLFLWEDNSEIRKRIKSMPCTGFHLIKATKENPKGKVLSCHFLLSIITYKTYSSIQDLSY